MDENDFNEIIKNASDVEDVFKAIADEADAKKSAQATKKDGLWYVADSADGGTSFYELVIHGKVLLHVAVANTIEMTIPYELPPGATAHGITVMNATRTSFRNTNGFALRYEHNDGTGVHVDGNTVRAYVLPRAMRWIAEFYGV